MSEPYFMTPEMVKRIDDGRYPHDTYCMHCEGNIGHEEVVWTGADNEDKSGWEVWFCCHACRDKNEPCETFWPIRLLPI
jgi:hypothetical protein